MFRYLRGFTGRGKKRNNVCNLCLFKNSREPIYMTDEELESKNQPKRIQTPSYSTDTYNYFKKDIEE